jgi:hypothetical protein
MSAHTLRTFEVPEALVAAGYGPTVDLDVLDREVEFPGEFGEWAEKVLFSENAKILEDVCGNERLLPRGILSSVQLDDDSTLVSGLVISDGRVWNKQFNVWEPADEEIDVVNDTIILDDDEVAFVARALREGADEVWFRPYLPKAFVSAVVAAPTPPTAREVPPGSAIVAVVDPIDEDAVLEMLAITPGPHTLRRHAGQWFEDPEWVEVLKSVKPPKIVKLAEPQVASVAAQVDRTTADQEWEPFDADTREQYQIFTASAGAVGRSSYLQELQNETDERALFALVAVAGREISPKDVVATERLKRYWTVGKGAAKIRWGTPGSWRRCYRHLVKYVGPKVAPGYCTNLSMRLGGPGIATHVGKVKPIPGKGIPGSADVEDLEPVTAANPTGRNGYDNGQSFEEATGGVQRDYFGRFAPEGGSNRSARAKRRKASMARRKKARDEKSAKKAGTTVDKAERARKKAENDAQREELASIALQIAQLRADGKDLEAAELRVHYAELAVQYADTPTQKLNAQAALVNARDALREKKYAIERQRRREADAEAERRRRERERASRETERTRAAQDDLERGLGI